MGSFVEENEWLSLYCTVPVLLVGISCFFLGIFSTLMHSKVFKWLGININDIMCYEKDITEIKKTTFQIAQEWIEVTKLITGIQDYQASFVDHFQSEFQKKCDVLDHNIAVFLAEEFSRNDDLFMSLKKTVETMQEDINSIKLSMQSLAIKSDQLAAEDEKIFNPTMVNSAAQTESGIRKWRSDTKIPNSKSTVNSEYEASKFINSVKKCLSDIIKNAKHQLTVDREEENKELEIIFSKLAEDREDIKKTIVHAFSIAADQAKKNYNQFGKISQEAMRYVAIHNEMLKTKLDDVDGRLKEILNAVKKQNFDAISIRETLENIDSQFDVIFQRVELGCRKNTEHCEEMAQSLEKASNNWMDSASELEKVSKEFCSDTKKMKEILKEMKNLVDFSEQNNMHDKSSKRKNELIQFESMSNSAVKDLLSQKQSNFINSIIQACWEKLSSMNNKVENDCDEICEITENLKHKLHSLIESFTKLDEVLGNIDTKALESHVSTARCCDSSSEEILETLVKTNLVVAGDTQPKIFQQITDGLTNKNLAQKIQNAIAIDKEVKMIELILRKVYEKRYFCQKNEEMVFLNSTQNAANTDESQVLLGDNNENKFINTETPEQYDPEASQKDAEESQVNS